MGIVLEINFKEIRMLSAVITNTLTNAFNSLISLIFFVSALIFYLKKDPGFSLYVVLFFLNLFALITLGVYVHYADVQTALPPGWLAISLLMIMQSYLLSHSLSMPDLLRVFLVFLAILSTFFFSILNAAFIFIALPTVLIYLIAACYAHPMLRAGFLMVVFSNIAWICLRQIENYVYGQEIPIEYRYDNDFYHVLLIIGIIMIYRAAIKGYWKNQMNQ